MLLDVAAKDKFIPAKGYVSFIWFHLAFCNWQEGGRARFETAHSPISHPSTFKTNPTQVRQTQTSMN